MKKQLSILFDQDTWTNIGTTALKIVFIIIISIIVVQVGRFIIRKIFKIKFHGRYSTRRAARTDIT